jgi:hypothetical protein
MNYGIEMLRQNTSAALGWPKVFNGNEKRERRGETKMTIFPSTAHSCCCSSAQLIFSPATYFISRNSGFARETHSMHNTAPRRRLYGCDANRR